MAKARVEREVKLWVLLLLMSLCLFQFFWQLGDRPFYSRGEAREGLVVQEIFTSGNWILPTVNGDYIPFKPPLFHWFGTLAANVTGTVNEFSVRFPSALFATLGVLLTYWAGARLWSEPTGRYGAFVLAANAEWWRAGTIAQVDMTLAFFIAATLWFFYFMHERQACGPWHSVVLAFLWACATLSKGPLGCLLPLLVVLLYLALRRDLAFLKRLHIILGALVFIMLVGGWYGLAILQGGWAFLSRQIIEENLGTARGVWGHYQAYHYFVPVFFYHLAPWSFFALSMAIFLCNRRGRVLFPLVWFVTMFVFFSVNLGKRGVYLLPLYPAFAILFGAWWESLVKDPTKFGWLAQWTGLLLALPSLLIASRLAMLLAQGEPGAKPFFPFKGAVARQILSTIVPPSPIVWISVLLFAGAALWMLVSLLRKSWPAVFTTLVLFATLSILFMKTTYYPPIAAVRSMKSFGIRLQQTIGLQSQLFFYNSFDAGTIFYSSRHIPQYSASDSALKLPYYLLIWEEDLERLPIRKQLELVATSEGRGPIGKHRLVVAKSAAILPSADVKQQNDVLKRDRDDVSSE